MQSGMCGCADAKHERHSFIHSIQASSIFANFLAIDECPRSAYIEALSSQHTATMLQSLRLSALGRRASPLLELSRTSSLKTSHTGAAQRFTATRATLRLQSSNISLSTPASSLTAVRPYATSSELDGSCKLSFDVVKPEVHDEQLHGQSLVICHGLL